MVVELRPRNFLAFLRQFGGYVPLMDTVLFLVGVLVMFAWAVHLGFVGYFVLPVYLPLAYLGSSYLRFTRWPKQAVDTDGRMVFECDSGRGRIDIEKSWLSLDDKGRHYLLEWAEIHDIDFCYGSRASKPRLIIELKKAATPKLQPPAARQIEILAMGCKVDAQYICQVLRAFLVEHGQTQRADKAV